MTNAGVQLVALALFDRIDDALHTSAVLCRLRSYLFRSEYKSA
jgi:hypothetical protein